MFPLTFKNYRGRLIIRSVWNVEVRVDSKHDSEYENFSHVAEG